MWAFYRHAKREQVSNNARLQSISARPNNVAASLGNKIEQTQMKTERENLQI